MKTKLPSTDLNAHRTGPCGQSGFTLFEVMVAVVITSIGLLGMASLQIASLNGTQSSHERTQATFLAYDLADRMRNNQAQLEAGNYDLNMNQTPNSATCYGEGANCSASQAAAADLSQWHTLVANTLTDGDASIDTNTPAGSSLTTVTITITWTDGRALPDLGDDNVDELIYVTEI